MAKIVAVILLIFVAVFNAEGRRLRNKRFTKYLSALTGTTSGGGSLINSFSSFFNEGNIQRFGGMATQMLGGRNGLSSSQSLGSAMGANEGSTLGGLNTFGGNTGGRRSSNRRANKRNNRNRNRAPRVKKPQSWNRLLRTNSWPETDSIPSSVPSSGSGSGGIDGFTFPFG